MAWLAVDSDGEEIIFNHKPDRYEETESWMCSEINEGTPHFVILPTGSINLLIGETLTWRNEPFEMRSCFHLKEIK